MDAASFYRHVIVAGAGGTAAVGLRLASDWHWMHAWNRAFADVALLLLVLALVLGPLGRLLKLSAAWMAWRRELGIWTVLFSAVHVWILLLGWVEWDITGFWMTPWPHGVFFDSAFAMGNLVGLAALAYGLVLLVTSNDIAMRVLGPGWKFLQRGATTHFVLCALHAGYFLFLHFEHTFHKPETPVNWLRTPFLVMVGAVFALQLIAFLWTIRSEGRATRGRRV